MMKEMEEWVDVDSCPWFKKYQEAKSGIFYEDLNPDFFLNCDLEFRLLSLKSAMETMGASIEGFDIPVLWDKDILVFVREKMAKFGMKEAENACPDKASDQSYIHYKYVKIPKLYAIIMSMQKMDSNTFLMMNKTTYTEMIYFKTIPAFLWHPHLTLKTFICAHYLHSSTDDFTKKTKMGIPVHFGHELSIARIKHDDYSDYVEFDESMKDGEIRDITNELILDDD